MIRSGVIRKRKRKNRTLKSRGIVGKKDRNVVLQFFFSLNRFCCRLKTLWSDISEKHKTAFAELENLMNPLGGFKLYKERLRQQPLPALPYFGK